MNIETFAKDAQIHELATICTRYADLKSAAKTAANNLTMLKFVLFTDMLTQDEISILKQAQEIAERISQTTGQYDAVRYFYSLQNETSAS